MLSDNTTTITLLYLISVIAAQYFSDDMIAFCFLLKADSFKLIALIALNKLKTPQLTQGDVAHTRH